MQGRDDVRRRNLATVLGIVHRRRRASRAEITQRTGLSRSSVGTLVADLEQAGIVTQSVGEERSGVGRPSPTVSLTGRYLAAAVNPDVTGVRVALVDLGGRVVDQQFHATREAPTPHEAAHLTATALADLSQGRPGSTVVGICAAIPGRVDKTGTTVRFAPHLRWADVGFGALLSEYTGLTGRVAFDAKVGLRAETLWGRAQTARDVVSFYGGPGGIGAAALVDGRLIDGSAGGAARLGHLMVATDGPTCVCGNIGCLTTLVSHHHLAAAYGLGQVSLAELRAAVLRETAPALRSFLDRQVGYLATALRMSAWAYDPELIMLGGFFEILLEAGRETLESAFSGGTLGPLGGPPALTVPALGADQLLAGAATEAFSPLLHDPLGFTQTHQEQVPASGGRAGG
ncbi:ROK family protein [Nonomuraea sp. PA05]|uniref:ROK family transcriptional regulator n=1 Tax=Nonomuraea sp. PA05 TaxID=2604466 RepID=UPI0011DA1C71|nr:ROK family transcriptional regulator [Nonomuraea sp. PA05]TYB56981.1 ROK family protein [Nonomuraea sp. PA05]